MAKQQNRAKKQDAQPAGGQSGSNKWKPLILAGAVAVITLVCLSPVLKNSFVNWDDNAYVYENPYLNKPVSEAVTFFFGPNYFVGNYIPVTMLTYVAEFHAGGMEPGFFHVVNLLLHLINVLLVFWFVWLLSGRRMMVAGVVALLFGIHPMHVESVAWIAELKDVLYSCFFLAGLIVYCRYLEAQEEGGGKAIRLLVFTFILFVLSCLSKPAAVVFPLVLLLLDYYYCRKLEVRFWLEKVPFLLVSLVFGIIAIKSQQADHLIHNYYPLSQRVFFATYSIFMYAAKCVVPFSLSNFYPYPDLVGGYLPWYFYLSPVFVALLGYIIYKTFRAYRFVAFGLMFFLVNVLLVLQLVSVGDAIMADRYTYIAYLGLFYIAAVAADKLYSSKDVHVTKWKNPVAALLLLVVLAFGYQSYARCAVWENDDSISDDLMSKYPDDRLVLNNKGFLLFAAGKYNESVPFFKRSIAKKPDYIMAHINLINSYIGMNDFSTAFLYTDSALLHAPKDFNLLTTRGFLLSTQNKYSEAIQSIKEALKMKKENMQGYLRLAECYYTIKDYDNWLLTLNEGLRYFPNEALLLNNKGYALYLKGMYQESIPFFKQALSEHPDFKTASVNLANSYKALDSVSAKK
jgi:protein O-mannosyl-transferase